MPSRTPKTKRAVHGIVLLDKPQGITSNRALQRTKHLYGAAKAGHTGSLDPMATGLLPLCFGEATKVANMLLGSSKQYRATCLLGITTNTEDAEGEVLTRHPVPDLDEPAIRRVLEDFHGVIDQVPPAFSALKRDGVPMYVRARRGEQIVQQARSVHIHRIDLLAWDGPQLHLRVHCGSGTYIRSLARDIGQALGCGAHLTALRREMVEPFRHPVMYTPEQLENMSMSERDACLLPVDAGLKRLPALRLDAADSRALTHGQPVPMAVAAGHYRAYADDGRLLALVERRDDAHIRVTRGFNLAK